MRRIFVTGIGTDVGKTVVAAILTEALTADYWKPVQTGNLAQTDTATVQQLIANKQSKFHPETYSLPAPLSPHAAAELENISLNPAHISVPATLNKLIIEGAGGLMVPLNKDYLMLDLIKDLAAEVVLVSRNYLGSINHTLLSLEILKARQIPVTGLIFNGEPNKASEEFILDYSGCPYLFSVLPEEEIDRQVIKKYAPLAQKALLNN